MQKATDENSQASVLIHALKFFSGAQWHISQSTPVAEFKWVDLEAEPETGVRPF
jgi:hypothetical protein